MKYNINSEIQLDNGVEIPILGLGTYKLNKNDTLKAVETAIKVGYKHIDTASLYGNEKEIGEALKALGVDLNEMFITTKLWNEDQGYDSTLRAFDESLKRLGTDYVDLYLIHWPEPKTRDESWDALVNIYESGRARAIGVSNYTSKHIDDLCKRSPIVPAVNQVEMSPFLYQKDLVDTCSVNRVKIEAYSPLTRGKKFDDKLINSMSKKYEKSVAQILIRWSIQHDFIVLPKSSNPDRIRENADVFDFEISAGDMMELDALDEGFRIAWNPEKIP